ncbi:MAG: P-loop NTPase [Nitrospira sp.]|uniref:Septum site-determining protein MinD n=1 Tax=Nitrospira defluvii TaxID=330214 RepID=A0ABM8RWX5_9BACT|nr:P-loop NTPase [Nitrospira defluvii]MCS6329557.1 P-loop NTPase [Nitrospira sp.]CAE6776469.1 Putative Septum site-determining protein MinD [Nitrospira defluvii]
MATIVSIGSGKGGVGKSIIAANLSMLMAKRGKRVVLADLDVGGADAHILFGMLNPPRTLTDFIDRRVARLDEVLQPISAHPFLQLLPGTGDTLATANLPYAKKRRLIRHFAQLQADVIVVDIGAGTSYHALDFFLMADHYVTVATPDPTSVLDLYRFIKLAAIRRVLSAFLSRDAVSEALSERDFSSIDEVIQAVGETDPNASEVASRTLQGFQPHLIVNRVSGKSRVNVLHLKKLLQEYVGGDLTTLGEIPDDPAVTRAVRSFLPVVECEPTAPASLALNQAADALLAAMARRVETPAEAVPEPQQAAHSPIPS